MDLKLANPSMALAASSCVLGSKWEYIEGYECQAWEYIQHYADDSPEKAPHRFNGNLFDD